MGTDEELRERILDIAERMFEADGYQGTKLRSIAAEAGVLPRTVRRLFTDKSTLFAQVMAARVRSEAGDRIAAAVADPGESPPMAAIADAAYAAFTSPGRSWEPLELEALARAQHHEGLREIEAERIQHRWKNARAVLGQLQKTGGIDGDIDIDSLTDMAMALSVGLAVLDPVLEHRSRAEDWDALVARIAVAITPPDMELSGEHAVSEAWRVRVDVPSVAGGVARLVRALDTLHTYTVGMQLVGIEDGYRTVDITLRAPEGVSRASLVATALSAGRSAYVTRGAPSDPEDMAAALLVEAARLVTNPSLAPQAAARILEADQWELAPATEGANDNTNTLRLQWTPELHVILRRNWAPFVRAESSRASALLRLAAAISAARGEVDALGTIEPIKDGAVWIRLARPDDADEVADMHERSSERTRYLRYVSTTTWRDVQLRRLSGGHRGGTLVAVDAGYHVVALGNVFPDADDPEGRTAEVALLVQDDHQGRGVGSVLLRHEIALARRLGFKYVSATVLAENTGMAHLLERTGLPWTSQIDSGVTTWRAPLGEAPAETPDAGTEADAEPDAGTEPATEPDARGESVAGDPREDPADLRDAPPRDLK